MVKATQIVAAVGALGVAGSILLGLAVLQAREANAVVHMAAMDTLSQGIDLNRIASFKYVDEKNLVVTDENGAEYRMEFVGACPGLKSARDFSLATESFRDLDKFSGIVLDGHYCAFRDFASRVVP